ncbi:MAG: K+/H+ antiporter subunit F [Cypionkella sp.]|nr:K+/H+ antiporter subunit F [Cypionkella sp.]
MLDLALNFAFVCFGLGLLLNLYRLFTAPGVPDRILALDTMVINVIAIVMLFGIKLGTGMFFEIALLFAMTGFISTVAFCKFLLRGDIIE